MEKEEIDSTIGFLKRKSFAVSCKNPGTPPKTEWFNVKKKQKPYKICGEIRSQNVKNVQYGAQFL